MRTRVSLFVVLVLLASVAFATEKPKKADPDESPAVAEARKDLEAAKKGR